MDKSNGDMRKQTDPFAEAATNSAPRPGDYELGSARSRAAARAMLKEKEAGKVVIKVHYIDKRGAQRAKKPYRIEHGPYAITEYYRSVDEEDTEEADSKSTY